MLVPRLLLPSDFRGSMFGPRFEGISLAGEEKVFGKDCYVIALSNARGLWMKLWLEKSSSMILRAFDNFSNATILYQPNPNAGIDESEFKSSPPT